MKAAVGFLTNSFVLPLCSEGVHLPLNNFFKYYVFMPTRAIQVWPLDGLWIIKCIWGIIAHQTIVNMHGLLMIHYEHNTDSSTWPWLNIEHFSYTTTRVSQYKLIIRDDDNKNEFLQTLNSHHTIGNCQRPVFSLAVYHHMHKITDQWILFLLNRSSKLRENNERNTNLSHVVVCFLMLDFETSNSKSEVSKSNSWKSTSFSKTTLLQREPFLTMFYTFNSSPFVVTK